MLLVLVIVGGSNSRFRSGWVGYLERTLGVEARNLSIGATTSLTGIYRSLLDDGPKPGDTVVWEYALNEVNHIKGGYEIANVLRSVEHLLQLYQRQGIRFAPVIFTPLREETADQRSPYFSQLVTLFDHYAVSAFDVSTEFRSLKGVNVIPQEYFADEQHYEKLDDLMQFITDGVIELIGRAAVPGQQHPIYTGKTEVALLSPEKFSIFENSVMKVPVSQVPVRTKVPYPGSLIAIMALCRPDEECGLRARIMVGEEERCGLRFSATSSPSFPKPILKAISVERATGAAWRVNPGEAIAVVPAAMGGRFFNEFLTLSMLSDPVKKPKAGVCGFLIERDQKAA